MKKRLLSLILCIAMIATLLVGCSNNNSNEASNKDANAEKVTADPVDTTKVFVSPKWVKSVIDGNQPESKNYVIAEGSWGATEQNEGYLKQHIPGAIHIDTDSLEYDNDEGVKDFDNYNIKPADVVEKVLLSNGITSDTTVILYGSDSGVDRIAFICLWAGVKNVKVMDGSIEAWKNTKYDVEKGAVEPKSQKEFGVKVPAHPEYVMDIKDVENKLKNDPNFRLVSIRSLEEFSGKTSGYNYIDKAGEPKGAVWGRAGTDASSMQDYMNEDGSYVDFDKVLGYFKDIDVTKDTNTAFYCGTGWRATIPWLMCYENGWKNITLFDGGWWQWQTQPNLPVQVGNPKDGDVKYTTVGELSTDKAKK
ncbi:rhodanese-like domain-containing protein [Clostridioides sp. ES-S-0190-01]|uniref:sulfurtransferase n=1 Tax=Clostridioides sp. ES-S-0190-01 TaxID=2770787 RepID=UPI001D118334|nr:sulfurtransferase [Clostridioides sp. ES-S-0190-01]